MKKTKSFIIGIVAILLCILCFAAVYSRFAPKPDTQGQNAFVLEVSDGEKNVRYEGQTEAGFLAGLFDQLQQTEDFQYESTSGDYGMYITSVNGVRADESQKTYWAIYVNGEYGQYGADSQPVNDGDSFALRLESYE